MLTETDLAALWITLKLAGLTTLILILLGTPLAWWLARTRFRGKVIVEAIVALPLVLPPTVLGFYLLLALGPHGPVGKMMQAIFKDNRVKRVLGVIVQFFGISIGDIGFGKEFVRRRQAGCIGIDTGSFEASLLQVINQ